MRIHRVRIDRVLHVAGKKKCVVEGVEGACRSYGLFVIRVVLNAFSLFLRGSNRFVLAKLCRFVVQQDVLA